jgi:hypothetical protein
MKHAEKITPIAAATSAVATLVCCLPVGFAAAAAFGSVSAVVVSYRPWFLGASMLLLLSGVVQVRRVQRTCPTRNTGSIAILIASAAVVLLVIFFPQVVATLVADWLPGGRR